MKLNFKKSTLLLSGLLAGGSLFAQTTDSVSTKNYVKPFSHSGAFRTWSIGINAGVLTPYSIFKSKEDFTSPNAEWGYGGYIKDQILPGFGLQADFFRGHVQGTDAQPITPYTKFRTNLNYAVDLSANITLANINWRNKKGAIQPYLTVGGGIMGYQPYLYTATTGASAYRTDGKNIMEAYIPLGLGFKINLGSGVNLDLGYQVNFVNSDNFDGYTYGTTFDKFSYAHAGLEFALGKHSKPQLATYNPVNSMRTEYLLKEQELQNAVDAERARNEQLKSQLDMTNSNLATTNANLAKLTADSDGDGVPDLFDKCPNTPSGVKVDGSGCPLPANKPDVKVYVTEEDRKVVKEAIKNLEFDLGKATIREKSFPSLDRVAKLLVDKNFSLKLAGHTDNVGSDALNMKLSKDRAESIKTYLVDKGANASRIEATGYGETQPIATNKTAAGRQQNRRVEFTLF